MDADNAQLHDKIRGCRSYDKVLRSVDAAIAHKIYPDLLFTYTAENIDAVEGVWKLALEKRLVLILDPVFALWGPDKVSPDVHRKAVELAKRPGVYLNRAHLLLRGKGGNRTRDPICRAASSTIVITPDNKLTLPCYHHRCSSVDINGGLTEAIKSGERLEAINREGRYAFCEGCHVNCYFDPTYQMTRGPLFWESMKSKAKYALAKYLIYRRPWPWIRNVVR
jgi:MoaA/NifB/PqqE/SkfB family radical SAM enzyme